MQDESTHPYSKLYCLDTDWSPPGGHELSYKPVLELMRCLGRFDYTMRNVATVEEFQHRIREWVGLPREKWWALVLSSHGSPGEIYLSGDSRIPLADIADTIWEAGGCEGRIVHLGACGTLGAPDEEIRKFIRKSRAKAVSGYAANVDWGQSVALELLFFDRLSKTRTWQFERLWQDLHTQVSGLLSSLRFTIWTESKTYRAE